MGWRRAAIYRKDRPRCGQDKANSGGFSMDTIRAGVGGLGGIRFAHLQRYKQLARIGAEIRVPALDVIQMLAWGTK